MKKINIKYITDEILVLQYIKSIKPRGFGHGEFQQQVCNPAKYNENIVIVDDICDDIFNNLSISRDMGLKCLNLCFQNITMDTEIDLSRIDANKIDQKIACLQSLIADNNYWLS